MFSISFLPRVFPYDMLIIFDTPWDERPMSAIVIFLNLVSKSFLMIWTYIRNKHCSDCYLMYPIIQWIHLFLIGGKKALEKLNYSGYLYQKHLDDIVWKQSMEWSVDTELIREWGLFSYRYWSLSPLLRLIYCWGTMWKISGFCG